MCATRAPRRSSSTRYTARPSIRMGSSRLPRPRPTPAIMTKSGTALRRSSGRAALFALALVNVDPQPLPLFLGAAFLAAQAASRIILILQAIFLPGLTLGGLLGRRNCGRSRQDDAGTDHDDGPDTHFF